MGYCLKHHFYDGQQVIREKYETDPAVIYVYGIGIDEPLLLAQDSTMRWYHFNQIGSVMSLSDSTGETVERYDYDVYGSPAIYNLIDSQWVKETWSSSGNPYYFTGRRWDVGMGLYHYRARAYNPTTGRFLQRDPYTLQDEYNFYEYCDSAPNVRIDPSGELTLVDWPGPGTDIFISVYINLKSDLMGPAMLRPLATKWQRDLDSVWGGPTKGYMGLYFKWSSTAGIHHYVSSNIQFRANVTFGNDQSFLYHQVCVGFINPRTGTTVSEVYDGPKTVTNNMRNLRGWWWAQETRGGVAHETGHLLGLEDEYKIIKSRRGGPEFVVRNGIKLYKRRTYKATTGQRVGLYGVKVAPWQKPVPIGLMATPTGSVLLRYFTYIIEDMRKMSPALTWFGSP